MFIVILFVAQTHNLFLCGLSANHSTTEPPTKTFLIVLSCFSFRAVRLCRLLQCHRVVGDNTVALTEMRGCGQIVKSTFLPFPKNFFLTSMENTIRSQKDVKENSDGLMKKKACGAQRNPTALALDYLIMQQQMLFTWGCCGKIMFQRWTTKNHILAVCPACSYCVVLCNLYKVDKHSFSIFSSR